MAAPARWVEVRPDGTLRMLWGRRAREVYLANRRAGRRRRQAYRATAKSLARVPRGESAFPSVWSGVKAHPGWRRCSLWTLETKRCPACQQPRWRRYAYRDYLAIRRPDGSWTVRSKAVKLYLAPSSRPPAPPTLRCNCFLPLPPPITVSMALNGLETRNSNP